MSEMRMDAYYYGFDPTGVPEIDKILSAVACAGKAYHHTEEWCDEASPYDYHDGKTPREWIQNAANEAKQAIDAAIAAERERCAKIADSMAFESKIAIANYKAIGELADAARHDHYRTRSTEIAAAIRRGKP